MRPSSRLLIALAATAQTVPTPGDHARAPRSRFKLLTRGALIGSRDREGGAVAEYESVLMIRFTKLWRDPLPLNCDPCT